MQPYLHTVDRRGRSNTNWLLQHQRYVNAWIERHNTIVVGLPTVDTRNAAIEYSHWYRERGQYYTFSIPITILLSPRGIRETALEWILLLPDAEFEAAAIWTIMRDMTYETLHGAGELSRLSHRPPPLHVLADEDHVQPFRVRRAPRNVRGSQHGGGRRRRVRDVDSSDCGVSPSQPSLHGASQEYDHGEGPHQPPGYGPSQWYHHGEGPSQATGYGPSQGYDHVEGPSQPTCYAEGASQSPITPPCYVQPPHSTTLSFPLFCAPSMIHASTTGIPTSPMPFAGFSAQSEDIMQPQESHHEAEIILRRTRRIRRPTGCGTHGILGPH